MASLKEDLLAQGLELRETHISQVFLSAERVWKVKKPVNLGFLDFSTLALRKQFCESEVTQNRRLAAGVYLGVVPIVRDEHGVHGIAARGEPGEPVEWAVEMRRLPDRDSAEQRLADGRLTRSDVQQLARELARFHAGARCDAETARYGELATIEGNVRENFEQTRVSAKRVLAERELAAIERWQLDFLRDNAPRFAARVRDQRIRDGHGDLRLEHCYLADDGHVDIIDCIEFNERFRYGDVCADVAFLAMDLAWHRRDDLSEALLAAYARESDDFDLYSVVDFYESYRAFVRGKVASMLESDPTIDAATRERAAHDARKYYLLAEACTRPSLQSPAVYAIGGLIASGKSSLSNRLAELVNAPVIDADRTRKHLAGVDLFQPLADGAFSGHYDQDTTATVYAELLRRAHVVLDSQRSVIIDASFRDRRHRALFVALAEQRGLPFLFIECTAPPEVCRARLAKRAQKPSISDGRLDVFDAFMASYQAVDELSPEQHLCLDTSQAKDAVLAQVRARVLRE